MEIIYLPKAVQDLDFWINSGNKAALKKIAQLTEAIVQYLKSLLFTGSLLKPLTFKNFSTKAGLDFRCSVSDL
jgi:hypothetical protein